MTAQDTSKLHRDADNWSNWFWSEFFPDWLARVQDGTWGVFDALDAEGNPDLTAGKSLLAQARTLFTISHAALLSGDPVLVDAAGRQAEFLSQFHKSSGLYRCMTMRDGRATGQVADEASRSYDHSFIILGLVTWNCVSPKDETVASIDACWEALQTQLTNPATGLLLNDDIGTNPQPAQNPHMHLYEACLQANRMTGETVWLTRAAHLRALGVEHFMDQDSGSIAEFLTPDLQPLPGADGLRRETGHQCEWAWLLWEEAELARDPTLGIPAARLMKFANRFGFAKDGLLNGAAFDAVSAAGDVVDDSFLLWPQTEAIKAFALQHTAGDIRAGDRARALLCTMFERWFEGRSCYVNRLDRDANSLWSEALTRLMYHLVLAMSEGSRAGLWSDVPQYNRA